MARTIVRLAVAATLAGGLAACASSSGERTTNLPSEAREGAVTTPDKPLQCVPYARAKSGVSIYGDAYTWWDQAAGHFARGFMPKQGAVLVLNGYAGPNRAHLAVVHDILSSREIRVDHANWLDDGAIYTDDPVIDVSANNDWSAVKVWNIRAGAWGVRTYNVQGFIGPGADDGVPLMARNGHPFVDSSISQASYSRGSETPDSADSDGLEPDTSHDADEADRPAIPTR